MVSLIKIIQENYQYDADDYVPYSELSVGDLVRDVNNVENIFTVIEILGDDKLLVQPVDEKKVVLPMFYNKEVIACTSDKTNRDDDDDTFEDLQENEDENDIRYDVNDPTSIVTYGKGLKENFQIVSENRGCSEENIEKVLNSILQKEMQRRGSKFCYGVVNVYSRPGSNMHVQFKFTRTGAYSTYDYSEGKEKNIKCLTVEGAAASVRRELMEFAYPEELAKHTIGFIVATYYGDEYQIYPMLDAEGVKIYNDAVDGLAAGIRNFYKGSKYFGD